VTKCFENDEQFYSMNNKKKKFILEGCGIPIVFTENKVIIRIK